MKIVEVKKTTKRAKVYDLTVPGYHNFAINNGVVVHNCIDSTRYALERVYRKHGNKA